MAATAAGSTDFFSSGVAALRCYPFSFGGRLLITRRKFVAGRGLVLADAVLRRDLSAVAKANSLDPSTLTAFVDPLPVPAIPQPTGTRVNPEDSKEQIPYYRISMCEAMVKVHRDLPPTKMWTLGGSFPGPTLETQSAKGMIVEW